LKRIGNLECSIDLNLSQDQGVKLLIEQAFDMYLLREFFAHAIIILKINLNLKAKQVIFCMIENVKWTKEDMVKLNDLTANRESPNNLDDEILTNQQWSCVKCTFFNDVDLKLCAMCSYPKDCLNVDNNLIFYS
jgi:hypothetical protein